MSDTLIRFDEVLDRQLLVVGEDVYDVSKFAKHHPGGDEILALRASDATLPLINAHGIQGELPKLPKKLRVGRIDEATLDPLDRELRKMWQDFRARGLFTYKRRWLALDAVRGIGLYMLALFAIQYSGILACLIFTTAHLNVVWWVHDVCHDSVFAVQKRSRFWAESISMLFVGTPVLDYQYGMHRIHHGFTNMIDADQALDTGPVVWHQRMMERSSKRFVSVQVWMWFLVVLPLTLPFFLFNALVHRTKRRDWWKIAIVAIRWTAAFYLFRHHLALLLVPLAVAGYLLSLTASLNHFHRPMTDALDPRFAHSVTRVTQNLRSRSSLAGWSMGGLNYHIEHHFFSTMPRHNYPVIAAEIEAFCTRNRLRYSTCTPFQAVRALSRKLRNPFINSIAASRV